MAPCRHAIRHDEAALATILVLDFAFDLDSVAGGAEGRAQSHAVAFGGERLRVRGGVNRAVGEREVALRGPIVNVKPPATGHGNVGTTKLQGGGSGIFTGKGQRDLGWGASGTQGGAGGEYHHA